MTRFTPLADRALCTIAHLHALQDQAPYGVSAYRKRDVDLRKRARAAKAPTLGARQFDLLEAMKSGSAPSVDNAWFERRWGLGEESAVARASARISAEAEALGTFGLDLGESAQVTASAAIRWAIASGPKVLVSMSSTGYHVLVALVAGRCRGSLRLDDLSRFDRHVAELHVAASLLAGLDGFADHVDPLLESVGRDLLPRTGSEAIQKEQLLRLAESVLDQPPGEVERIASGFHQGRTDRLHRAWSRGFFYPRGLSTKKLLSSLGN